MTITYESLAAARDAALEEAAAVAEATVVYQSKYGRITGHSAAYDIRRLKSTALHRGAVPKDWKLGTWLEVQSLDEMEAFYRSRLPAIREAAKEHGYAIGMHGTARRDFDLMAMQWREDASDKDALAHAIAKAACGITRNGAYQWETKPSGRFAVSLPICVTNCANSDFDKPSIGHIDLSLIEQPSETLENRSNWFKKWDGNPDQHPANPAAATDNLESVRTGLRAAMNECATRKE